MAKRDLAAMVDDMDYPDDVAAAVSNEVAKIGTEGKILAGELQLPARQDAIHWHDRMMGRGGITEQERKMDERIRQLEAQLNPPEQVKGAE